MGTKKYPFVKEAEAEGNKAAVMAFTFAMKAEEVYSFIGSTREP